MHSTLELLLFIATTVIYVVAWAWHLRGWQQGSSKRTATAIRILWAGWALHVAMVGLRWYRADHVPMLSAFEFVTFFAMLVIGCFLEPIASISILVPVLMPIITKVGIDHICCWQCVFLDVGFKKCLSKTCLTDA